FDSGASAFGVAFTKDFLQIPQQQRFDDVRHDDHACRPYTLRSTRATSTRHEMRCHHSELDRRATQAGCRALDTWRRSAGAMTKRLRALGLACLTGAPAPAPSMPPRWSGRDWQQRT